MWLIFNNELMKNLIRTIDPSIFTKVTYDRVIYDALTDNVIVTGGEEEEVEEEEKKQKEKRTLYNRNYYTLHRKETHS